METLVEILSTYGVLGLWTGYMVWKESTIHRQLIDTLGDLKSAMVKCNK